MQTLILALALFVATHLLMSHPLRATMLQTLGDVGFQIAYSLISLATFVWAVFAFRSAPTSAQFWEVGDGLWGVSTLLMLVASILLVGSFIGNPALPQPKAAELATAPARGVFAITRHPMMWSFAIWSLAHILVAPHGKVIILCGAFGLLALAGSLGQDRKKSVLMGESWSNWASRTSFIPFANQASGKSGWSSAWPGSRIALAGGLLWLIATYGHAWFGIYGAGVWRWLWA
jgi:uncharacterized membrane protein